MKVFDITADITKRQEYEVESSCDGYFNCPVCKRTVLKFEEHQYHSDDPSYKAPRACCSNCGAVFFPIPQR